MQYSKRRVVKVGGSLLTLPNLRDRLNDWLDDHNDAQNVIIAGGGQLVECLRHWDELYGLSSRFAHQEGIALMSSTARLVARLVREARLISSISEIGNQHKYVLDVSEFVLEQSNLPESWTVTSDSIAAAVAIELGADLFLLKSSAPESSDVCHWCKTELVDQHFPELADSLPVVCVVNLRSPDFTTVRCRHAGIVP